MISASFESGVAVVGCEEVSRMERIDSRAGGASNNRIVAQLKVEECGRSSSGMYMSRGPRGKSAIR